MISLKPKNGRKVNENDKISFVQSKKNLQIIIFASLRDFVADRVWKYPIFFLVVIVQSHY